MRKMSSPLDFCIFLTLTMSGGVSMVKEHSRKGGQRNLETLVRVCGGYRMTCGCGRIFYCDGNCPIERCNNYSKENTPKDFCLCPPCLEKSPHLGKEYVIVRRKCFLKVDKWEKRRSFWLSLLVRLWINAVLVRKNSFVQEDVSLSVMDPRCQEE